MSNWIYLSGGIIIIMALLLATVDAADQRSSFYDRNGHYQGSSITNRYGTTSYYDRNGHYLGAEKKK